MPQPAVRRIALRAVQFAIAAAGILVIFLVFSRQADAASLDPPPATPAPAPVAPLSAATSGITSATSGITSAAPRR